MQIFTIILMCILTGAEIDLFIPSFPELRKIFNLSVFEVELTIFVNLVAHCFSALFVGNLGDKYGRKPIIIIGLLIFIIGSLFCLSTNNFFLLLFGRFLQGIGISAPAVLSYLVIADIYSIEKQQKIMGMLNGSITFAMAFAPVLGSYINLFFNWRGNFFLLLVLGIFSLILTLLFITKGSTCKDISLSFKEYLPVISSKEVIYYILTICMFVQAYWVFVSLSPILYMNDLGVKLNIYGLYQGAMCLVFAFTSFFSNFFFKKFGTKKCLYSSIILILIFLFFTFILIISDNKNPLIITLVFLILSIALVSPINILYPMALEIIPNSKGKIAALIVSTRLIITSLTVQIVSLIYDNRFFYIGISIIFSLIIGLWTFYKLYSQYNIFRNK